MDTSRSSELSAGVGYLFWKSDLRITSPRLFFAGGEQIVMLALWLAESDVAASENLLELCCSASLSLTATIILLASALLRLITRPRFLAEELGV